MKLTRLLTALAVPLGITATVWAGDQYLPTVPPSGYQYVPAPAPSDATPASLWLRRPSQPVCVTPQPICSPYPGATMPGMAPGAPGMPGQPGQAPGTPSPVQTPEAAAAAPQTNAFSQAPSAGGSAGYSFAPNMIGDLGVGGSFARGLAFLPGTAAPRPSTGNGGGGGNGGGLVGRVLPLPATGRGAFKIDENESPRPVDRFFVTYNYFNGIGSGIPGFPTFDLHRETFGFEKTFLNGDASIGMRFNTLQSNGDGSLGGSDFGDITIVTKFALINEPNGNVVSGGIAVTVPTGPDLILLDGSRLNPVLIQPYTGFIYVMDKLFAQGFSSLIIPTDSRDVLLSSGSLAFGYKLYEAACPQDSLVSYIIPTIEGHTTIAVNHRGIDNSPTGFPDLFVLTNGVHIGLGRGADLTLGVAVPLTGPKLFNVEGQVLFNFRF